MSRDLDSVADVLAAARLILGYVDGVPYDQFVDDTMRQDAVIRELLIIGEAAKRISEEFKAAHPKIPWRQMAGMRDILVHAYDHVDMDAVWSVATTDISDLITALGPLVQTPE